jgi:excisionase family DNA binding protein
MPTYSQGRVAIWVSLPQAARELGVCESSIRRWIKAGDLPAMVVGPGRRYRIDTADLAQMRVQPEIVR